MISLHRRSTRLVLAALCAGILAPGLAGAAVPKKGKFSGSSSQVHPDTGQALLMELNVKKGGKKVKKLRAAFLATCPDGSSYISAFFVQPAGKINDKGRFKFDVYYKDPPDLNPGETADIFVEGSGKFTSKTTARGSLNLQANIFAPGAQVAMKCFTGKITWTANR
jgi:hypothetical protein